MGTSVKYSACSEPQPAPVAINILIRQVGVLCVPHSWAQEPTNSTVHFIGIQIIEKFRVFNETESASAYRK
jgi:hypothetical protein